MTSTKPKIIQLHVPLLFFNMAFPALQRHSALSLVFTVAQLISFKSTKLFSSFADQSYGFFI